MIYSALKCWRVHEIIMIYFLLLVSFLIHIVTFIIIKQMKNNQSQLQQVEDNVNQQVNELQDSLAVYLLEIKEENEFLVQQLDHLDVQSQKDQESTREESSIQEEKTTDNKHEAETNQSTFSAIESSDVVPDAVESSITSQALYLKEKGYTTDEIAKKLNKGKTEIDLLLKFYQKK